MKKFITIIAMGAMVLTTGCSSINMDKKWQGTIAGTVIGTAAGAAIGHQSDNKGTGALIGAGAGALGGYAVGNAMEDDVPESTTPPSEVRQ